MFEKILKVLEEWNPLNEELRPQCTSSYDIIAIAIKIFLSSLHGENDDKYDLARYVYKYFEYHYGTGNIYLDDMRKYTDRMLPTEEERLQEFTGYRFKDPDFFMPLSQIELWPI